MSDDEPKAKSLANVAVTLLVSSGAISIVGPLIGQLYWRGYLEVFGLTPEEFPASEADTRTYAYIVILNLVQEAWQALYNWLGVIAIAIVIIVAIVAVWQSQPIKEMLEQRRKWLRAIVLAETIGGFASQVVVVSALSLLSFAFLFYLVTVAALVVIAPASAMQRGRFDAFQRLESMIGDATKPRLPCSTVHVEGTTFDCPYEIAYNKDEIAVLDNGRLVRVARTSAQHSSPLPPRK